MFFRWSQLSENRKSDLAKYVSHRRITSNPFRIQHFCCWNLASQVNRVESARQTLCLKFSDFYTDFSHWLLSHVQLWAAAIQWDSYISPLIRPPWNLLLFFGLLPSSVGRMNLYGAISRLLTLFWTRTVKKFRFLDFKQPIPGLTPSSCSPFWWRYWVNPRLYNRVTLLETHQKTKIKNEKNDLQRNGIRVHHSEKHSAKLAEKTGRRVRVADGCDWIHSKFERNFEGEKLNSELTPTGILFYYVCTCNSLCCKTNRCTACWKLPSNVL